MLVYRVQGKNGNGPYVFPPFLLTDPCAVHPLPEDDGIPKKSITEFHHFGFESLDILRSWFDLETRTNLARDGFSVVVYDVPLARVIVGGRQVIFDYDYARTVKTLDIIDFICK